MKIKHNCKIHANCNIFNKGGCNWALMTKMGHLLYINYCPYCGEELI